MESSLIQEFDKDDVFHDFLLDSFDIKVHANDCLQNTLISEHLSKLSDGIHLLNQEIHSQIVSHHEDLLSTSISVETLEGVLHMMQNRIQNLMAAMERISAKVSEPYTKMKTETAKLRKLQQTCDLLRKIIRMNYLSKKLKLQLEGGTKEITKAAQSLKELDHVCEGVDLSGIDIIEQDRRFIKQSRREVEDQARKMLNQGLESQNQIQVATALQVFYNLGLLSTQVNRSLSSCKDFLYEKINSSLDIKLLSQDFSSKGGMQGRSTMPTVGSTAVFRANLWTSLSNLMDTIFILCSQVQHLEKVLIKKYDPVTQVSFLDEIKLNSEQNVNIMAQFWASVTTILHNEFYTAANASTFLKQTFEGEYPKLLRLFNDLWKRLQQFHLTQVPGGAADDKYYLGDHPPDEENVTLESQKKELDLRSTLQQFETAYLSRSLSRLFDPINLIFTNMSTMPTTEEINNLIKIISSELSVAAVDSDLLLLIAKNISKTINLFCAKTEQLLSTDDDSTQVIGPATPSQTHNVTVINSLHFFTTSLSKSFSDQNLEERAMAVLNDSLEQIYKLMVVSVQPLLTSVADALSAILQTMHLEDFSEPAPPSSGSTTHQCSLYMRELQDFISSSYFSYFAPFTCTDFIMESLLPVASRCAELFIRYASLIRPLGDGGKLKLAADFAQAELALSPFCRHISDIGPSYKILRALRPLLFQKSELIPENTAIGEIVPYVIVIHFLFSRAFADLKSPHQLSNWSVAQYSQWLDDHPHQQDQLTLIKGALEAYVKMVKAKEGKEYDPVYPIMLSLLKKGLDLS